MVRTDEERKAKDRVYSKKYRKRQENQPKIKVYQKTYRENLENKAKKKVYQKDYWQKTEVIAKNKARHQTPESKAVAKNTKYEKRLKVLQHYSKSLSNSDVPCCNCCGLNNYIEFLALDHIAGRYKIYSEPELVKLGYSSKFSSPSLINWIVKNDYPDSFQILCHNCNTAKGMIKNNNECPMKNKPH